MFHLPPVDEYTLSDPPLAQALVQIRFPIVARLQSLEGIAPLQQRLEESFPFMERVTETNLLVGPAGPMDAMPEQAVSWYFTDENGRLLVIGANSATLSVSGPQYEGVADFRQRFTEVLHALAEVVPMRRCDRLGVRYLDIVPAPQQGDGAWRGWFKPELLGWLSTDIVHKDVELHSTISQTRLVSAPFGELSHFPADIQAVVRHGVSEQNSTIPGMPPLTLPERSFVLDLDLILVAAQPYSAEALSDQCTVLHGQIDRFFRWTLTEDGEERFGLKERA